MCSYNGLSVLDETEFALKDQYAETIYGFNIPASLKKAQSEKLLQVCVYGVCYVMLLPACVGTHILLHTSSDSLPRVSQRNHQMCWRRSNIALTGLAIYFSCL